MEKKKKNHIQVNDRRHTTGDMTSEWSIKCPLGSMVLEKGERNKNIKKKNTFFFFVRNVLLYIQWQSQLFSQTPAHTHSFILVLLISNTSVKCNTYIYLYIMKELKRLFFFQEQFTALWTATGMRILIESWCLRETTPRFSFPRPNLETDYTSKLICSPSKHKVQFHAAFKALQLKNSFFQHICYHRNKWYGLIMSQTSQICTSHTMSYIVVKIVKNIVHQYKYTESTFLQELYQW